ncbi:MAG: hypothetical protein PUE21_05035 [Lachnospiraceae bacterium]|nr:hypothetical protein [Lachnospiraceae bacterium]
MPKTVGVVNDVSIAPTEENEIHNIMILSPSVYGRRVFISKEPLSATKSDRR